MSGKIVQLKNFFKTLNIFPYTLTKAVFDEDGNRLDNTLTKLNSDLVVERMTLSIGEYNSILLPEKDGYTINNVMLIDANNKVVLPTSYIAKGLSVRIFECISTGLNTTPLTSGSFTMDVTYKRNN